MSEVGGRSDEDAVPLGRAALVATASVTAFNASIYLMAVAVGVFGSMGWLPAGRTAEVKLGPVLVGSVIAALAGVGVYGLVRRHARRPYPTFLIIAAGVLAASMVVPFQMGWPLSQVLVLEVMHVVAAAGVIWAVSR